MGWCFQNTPLTRPQVKAEITRMATWETDSYTVSPLRVVNHGSTWYAAVQYVPKNDACAIPFSEYDVKPGAPVVLALIFLTRNSKRDGFGYKDMSESLGPVESTCPASVLKMLSPLKPSAEWAQAWRDRCTARNELRAAIKDGVTVKLASPIKFQGGFEGDTFTATTYHRRGQHRRCYRGTDGALYRLTDYSLIGAKIVA